MQPFLTTAVRVHDDVLEKKGPVGKNWRTNSEPLNPQRRERFLKRKNKRRQQLASSLLAQAGTPPHEELEIFHRLCRGERLRVSSLSIRIQLSLVTKSSIEIGIKIGLDRTENLRFILALLEFLISWKSCHKKDVSNASLLTINHYFLLIFRKKDHL